MTYLSFIVSGRNDGYGLNYLYRLKNFLNSIRILSEQEKVKTETIVVEWNPVEDSPMLSNVLKFPKNEFNTIRFIIVPNKFHQKFKNPRKLPLHDYVAKNIAIVRAKGEYLMVCSGDLIYPRELFRLFHQKILKPGIIYRNSRIDFSKFTNEEISSKTYEAFIARIKQNIISNTYGGTKVFTDFVNSVPLTNGYFSPRRKKPFFNGCGDFLLMNKKDWIDVTGCVCNTNYFAHLDGATYKKILLAKKKEMIFHPKYAFFHMDHSRPHINASYKNMPYPNSNINRGDWGFEKEKFKEIET